MFNVMPALYGQIPVLAERTEDRIMFLLYCAFLDAAAIHRMQLENTDYVLAIGPADSLDIQFTSPPPHPELQSFAAILSASPPHTVLALTLESTGELFRYWSPAFTLAVGVNGIDMSMMVNGCWLTVAEPHDRYPRGYLMDEYGKMRFIGMDWTVKGDGDG